jgi:hypothetical protein
VQQEQPCPGCGQAIPTTTWRCRHCGTEFEVAGQDNADRLRSQFGRKMRLAQMRWGLIGLFVFGVVTCTAPLAALVGGPWVLVHRAKFRQLPGWYGALALVGLGSAIGQTALILVLAALYTLWEMS